MIQANEPGINCILIKACLFTNKLNYLEMGSKATTPCQQPAMLVHVSPTYCTSLNAFLDWSICILFLM